MAPLHKWLARMAMLSTAGACLWRVSAPMPSPSPAPAAMTRSMERGDESAAQGGGDESPLWHPWRRRCSGGDFRTGGGAAVVRWQRHAAARRRHAARRRPPHCLHTSYTLHLQL